MQRKYRVRFVELLHPDDGIVNIEVVVEALDEFGAVARATLLLTSKDIQMTWVDWVKEEDK